MTPERSYSIVADGKLVVCKASGNILGLLPAMLSVAAHQSHMLARPVEIWADDKIFRIVEVRIPRDK